MAADQAILEAVGRGDSLPTLRLYSWEPACLSLGFAQSAKDADEQALAEQGWDLVRRATGGRAILHVDELTYSVIAPPDEPRVAGTITESYRRLAGALIGALLTLGLPVEMEAKAPHPATTRGAVCFEVPSAYEIVVHGKKLVGSAQVRTKDGVLQHGTLPLHGDLTRITRALTFADGQVRAVAAEKLLRRATTVEIVMGRIIPWEDAARAFVDSFEREFGLSFERTGLSQAEDARTAELVGSKYGHADWTFRAVGEAGTIAGATSTQAPPFD